MTDRELLKRALDEMKHGRDAHGRPLIHTAAYTDLRAALAAPQAEQHLVPMAAVDAWKWMTHPTWNGGKPIPVRMTGTATDVRYQPFDVDGDEFAWSERSPEWKEVAAPPTRKPLTTFEINDVMEKHGFGHIPLDTVDLEDVARAVERAHGIVGGGE